MAKYSTPLEKKDFVRLGPVKLAVDLDGYYLISGVLGARVYAPEGGVFAKTFAFPEAPDLGSEVSISRFVKDANDDGVIRDLVFEWNLGPLISLSPQLTRGEKTEVEAGDFLGNAGEEGLLIRFRCLFIDKDTGASRIEIINPIDFLREVYKKGELGFPGEASGQLVTKKKGTVDSETELSTAETLGIAGIAAALLFALFKW